jgi:putative FmdB family regulatory protein
MPMYEYHCAKCKKQFEELVMGSEKGVKCPKCGNKKVKKLMSAFAHKSGDKFSSSKGGSGGCSGCHSHNCSSCGH